MVVGVGAGLMRRFVRGRAHLRRDDGKQREEEETKEVEHRRRLWCTLFFDDGRPSVSFSNKFVLVLGFFERPAGFFEETRVTFEEPATRVTYTACTLEARSIGEGPGGPGLGPQALRPWALRGSRHARARLHWRAEERRIDMASKHGRRARSNRTILAFVVVPRNMQ